MRFQRPMSASPSTFLAPGSDFAAPWGATTGDVCLFCCAGRRYTGASNSIVAAAKRTGVFLSMTRALQQAGGGIAEYTARRGETLSGTFVILSEWAQCARRRPP